MRILLVLAVVWKVLAKVMTDLRKSPAQQTFEPLRECDCDCCAVAKVAVIAIVVVMCNVLVIAIVAQLHKLLAVWLQLTYRDCLAPLWLSSEKCNC